MLLNEIVGNSESVKREKSSLDYVCCYGFVLRTLVSLLREKQSKLHGVSVLLWNNNCFTNKLQCSQKFGTEMVGMFHIFIR